MSILAKRTTRAASSLVVLFALTHCAAETDDEEVPPTATQSAPLNGTYLGCYTDSASRALPTLIGKGYDVQGCIDAVRARGLAYAGLQYYGECWGGAAVGYTKAAESECNTPCTANGAQTCGGRWRNSIYSTAGATPPPGSTYVGCYTDEASRALPTKIGTGFDVSRCVEAARARGLPYAGLQYYGECWGGSSVGYSRAPESDCNTPCSADPSQTCGGGWRNSIYATGSAPPSPPPSPPPPSGRIKVVSWNTRNAQNPSGQTAVLGPLAADVIFLQEVGGQGSSYVSGMNSYEANVARSGKTWRISADGALMTWRPIVGSMEVKDLGQNSWPNNYDWTNNPHRTAARATIDFNGTSVHFFGTHLDWNPNGDMTNHIENRTKLAAWLDTFSGRKVFGGDMNAWTWGDSSTEGNEQRTTISQLGSRGTDVCVELRGVNACNSDATNNGWTPDHVYRSSGLATMSYAVVDKSSLSDHRMLVVELELR